MKHSFGWTLIELVLTLSLIGLMLVFGMRFTFDVSSFKEYQFQQQLTMALQKAHMASLYTQQKVILNVEAQSLLFYLSQTPQTAWQVELPDNIHFNPQQFPYTFEQSNGVVTLSTSKQSYQIEPYHVIHP